MFFKKFCLKRFLVIFVYFLCINCEMIALKIFVPFFFLFLIQVNPFRDRLCSVFSNDKDYMNFEEFLDMMSVLSSNAPKDLKAHYAFNVYGLFDISLYIKLSASIIRSLRYWIWEVGEAENISVPLCVCAYIRAWN